MMIVSYGIQELPLDQRQLMEFQGVSQLSGSSGITKFYKTVPVKRLKLWLHKTIHTETALRCNLQGSFWTPSFAQNASQK
jgi:hypothetical protein